MGRIASRAIGRRLRVLEAAGALLAARLLVALLPFERLARRLCRTPRREPDLGAETGSKVGEVTAAIASAARWMPWRFVCLPRAVAAHAMLRRRGIRSIVYFGARRRGAMETHAWVTAGAMGVVGHETAREYTIVARYPPEKP